MEDNTSFLHVYHDIGVFKLRMSKLTIHCPNIGARFLISHAIPDGYGSEYCVRCLQRCWFEPVRFEFIEDDGKKTQTK